MGRTRSDIQPRIIEAARDRFLREGVDGASLRAIAADARTSVGMIYYYFPTKDDLFFGVVEESYALLLEGLTAALAPDVPVAARIHRIFRRIGAMTERESLTVRLVLREILVSSSRLQRLLERFQRGHIPLVLATILDGMRDGTLRRDLHPLVLMLATFAIGAAPQFVLHHAGARLPVPAAMRGDALAGVLAELWLHGAGAATSAAQLTSIAPPGGRRSPAKRRSRSATRAPRRPRAPR